MLAVFWLNGILDRSERVTVLGRRNCALRVTASSCFESGEMSEWLKEHAWKATSPTLTERH